MKNTKLFGACFAAVLAISGLTGCNRSKSGADTYDKDGRLILNLKNVYFDTWDGSDTYTEIIN